MPILESVPESLNWVEVRIGCLIKNAFESLRAKVEEDVNSYNEKLNGQISQQVSYVFGMSSMFAVISRGREFIRVDFQLQGKTVEIRRDEKLTLQVTPVFSDLGRCRWKLNDEELEQWQIRKLALEELLFPPYFSL
jgi:hypothetical protein